MCEKLKIHRHIKRKEKAMDYTTITDIDLKDDTGATTAEYAITTLAACGFAALLVVLLKSDPVSEAVMGVIQLALGMGR